MDKAKQYLKMFLAFCKLAAPVAATVAESTGHSDVVGDINKAGNAAKSLDEVIK